MKLKPWKCPYENQSFPRATKPKKNSQIDYLPTDGDEWLSETVLGRAGKVPGKYGHHWNVQNEENYKY